MRTNKAVSMPGKAVYYRQDGSGRDTYIKFSNGGLLSNDRVHSLKQIHSKPSPDRRMVFGKTGPVRKTGSSPQKNSKFSHYLSDGTGRDWYIATTEGGNLVPFNCKNHVDLKFKNSLRSSESRTYERNPEDVFTKTQSSFSKSIMLKSASMSIYQKSLTSRLAEPKKRVKPSAMETYFAKQKMASNGFRTLYAK